MASESGSDNDYRKRPNVSVENVVDAINSLKESKGATLTSLKKFIAYNAPQGGKKSRELALQIKRALKRGLKDGQICRVNGYKFVTDTGDDQEAVEGSKRGRRRDLEDGDMRPHRSRRRSKRRRRRSRRRRYGRKRRRSRRRKRDGRKIRMRRSKRRKGCRK